MRLISLVLALVAIVGIVIYAKDSTTTTLPVTNQNVREQTKQIMDQAKESAEQLQKQLEEQQKKMEELNQ